MAIASKVGAVTALVDLTVPEKSRDVPFGRIAPDRQPEDDAGDNPAARLTLTFKVVRP